MTFRARIMMLGWLGAAAAIVVGLASLFVQFYLQSDIERNATLAQAARDYMEMDMAQDLIRADMQNVRLALLENKPEQLAAIKQELDEHVERFRAQLDTSLKLSLAEAEHTAILDIKPMMEVYVDTAYDLMSKASSHPDDFHAGLAAFQTQFEEMESRDQVISKQLAGALKQSTDDLNLSITHSKMGVVVMLLIAIAGVIIFARRVAEQMSTLLGGEPEQTIDLVNRMATGSIDTHIEIGNAHPHSVLAAIAGLRKNLIKTLQETSSNLASVIPELTTAATQTREDMRKQSDETHTMVTATTQLAAASEDVAKNASIVSSSTQDARNQALQGKHAADDAIRANKELSTHMNCAVSVVGKLNTGSQQITTFVEVIRTIAEQTNLLALNAAIEAARAGDQGRGFAVVADEVRTLAQRTQGATQEIEQIIASLSQAALEATDSIRKGESLAEDSVSRTTELSVMLETINKSIVAVDEGNAQIATAAEEQSAVTRNINSNIERIADVSRKASAAAERTMIAVCSVNSAVDQLGKMANQKAG